MNTYIEGAVSVTNGGAVATEDLAITIELRDGFPPPNDLIATASVDISSNPVLDPGETGTYPYKITIPPPIGTGTYKITAVVTITNHSGKLGTPFGPNPSATCKLPGSPTLINDVIHVDDDNVENPIGQDWDWEFSASGSVTYDKTFTCDDEGENWNTATIVETGQSDDALVTVKCLGYPPTQVGSISGYKFYDTNTNGVWDNGEPAIEGWKVHLTGTNIDEDTVDEYAYTNADGEFIFSDLLPGNYTVTEVFPSSPYYVATTDTSFSYELKEGEEYVGPNFGNVCLKPGYGGRTLGFWANKNGQALIDNGDLKALHDLNLKNKTGHNFDPTTYTQLRTWLLNAEATNMAYMLSAQLAATKLNVLNGFLSGSTMVYIPSSGFISIDDIMKKANTLLGADGYTPAGDQNRAEQEFWKNILDGLNNNKLYFVCPSPCYPLVYP